MITAIPLMASICSFSGIFIHCFFCNFVQKVLEKNIDEELDILALWNKPTHKFYKNKS